VHTVKQKHDAECVGSDGHPRHYDPGKQQRHEQSPDAPEPHPVINEQGQTTGKVVDITA